MYIGDILMLEGLIPCPLRSNELTSTFSWTLPRSSALKKLSHAKTETEAIERALDFAIAEHEKNRLVLQATERFIKSGIEIKDVYGTLVG